MPPRKWPQLRNEVRVWQESHVEHQIGVVRYTVLETETDGRDKNRRRLGGLRLKCLVNMRPQFMNIEFGCIQYNVCNSPDRSQSASLAGKRFLFRVIGPEWMRPPRLAITAEQDVILRFQEYQRRVVFSSQFAENCWELL